MPRRNQPELNFHKTVAQFLDRALPDSCWYTTFPSGGGGKARGAKLKACGLKPGVADVLILFGGGTATDVIWIELKAKAGRLSDSQKEFFASMSRFGRVYTYAAKKIEGVQTILETHGIPLKASVA